MEQQIRKSFEGLADRTIADAWPERDAAGTWQTPGGKPITRVFVLSSTRPKEQDGVPFTAYASVDEKKYWVHEGGGISGIDRWYGPFSIP